MIKKSINVTSLFGLDSSDYQTIEGYDNIVSALKTERLNYLNKPRYIPRKIVLVYEYTNFLGTRNHSSLIQNSIRASYIIEYLDLIINAENMKDLKYHLRIYNKGIS